MQKTGVLRKMMAEPGEVVKYFMNLNNEPVFEMNTMVGKVFKLSWTGNIYCINCGRATKKSFAQGFCYDCFKSAAQASICIIRPELCEAHLGKGRDPEWEEANHNQPHYVYLAQTSGIKVGITRSVQMPSRWIDQGAWRASVIARVPYRQMAGAIEVELKQYLTDRTDWRKMLTDERDEDDLEKTCLQLVSFLPSQYAEYAKDSCEIVELKYPVLEYPKKVKSLKLEERKTIEAVLTGIRGQYLYFAGNRVINMRKYSGYEVTAGPV